MAGEQDWRESLPSEIKVSDSLSKFKDVGSLAKSYLSLEQMLGSSVRMPKEDAKPEEWDTYYGKWGRPEKPDGYKFPSVPKEYDVQDDFKASIGSLAHSLGLNQKQYDSMIAWGMTQSKAINDKQLELNAKATKELRDKWGFAADANTERAHKTIAMLAGYNAKHPFVTWLEETGNDKNPMLIDFFYEVSKQMDEDNFVDEAVKKEDANKATAQNKINEIMADAKHPYFNEHSPMHKQAVDEVAKLYQALTNE